MDINRQTILGRIGHIRECRYTSNGRAVINLSVATNKEWQNDDGTTHKETAWFEVVVWGKMAEAVKKYCQKGDRIYVEAEYSPRKFMDNKTGNERTTHEWVVRGPEHKIVFLTYHDRASAGAEAPPAGERPDWAGKPAATGAGDDYQEGKKPAAKEPEAYQSDSELPF